MKYKTLVDVLIARSSDTHGITFIESSSMEERLSYKDLYVKSLVVLHNFQKKGLLPGYEVVIQLDNNRDFIIVFWACILGAFIPVPLNITRNEEQALKTINVWKLLNNPYMVSSAQNFN